jgi:N-dimethylarginine dimethylaminohydrolase
MGQNIILFRPEDDRFGRRGPEGWENLKTKFNDITNVTVINNNEDFLFTRDPFIIIGDKAYYPSGENNEHPLDQAPGPVREYTDVLTDSGIEIVPVPIEQKQYTQGGNVVSDPYRNLAYIGSAGNSITPDSHTFQALATAVKQHSGVDLTLVRSSAVHIDSALAVLPTGDIYADLNQGPTTHVRPADTSAALSGSGISKGSLQQTLGPLVEETGHVLFVGMQHEPKYTGGGRWSDEPRRPDGFTSVEEIKNTKYKSLFNDDHIQAINLNSEENEHIVSDKQDMSANFIMVGNTVFGQEMPQELQTHLRNHGFEVDLTPGAHYDSFGGVRCMAVPVVHASP